MLKVDIPWLADGYKTNLKTDSQIEQEIFPNDEDNFSLCADEYLNSYADVRVSTPIHFKRNPRVKSAQPRLSFKQVLAERNRSETPRRPFSARPPSGRRPNAQRQIKSAGTRSSLCSRHGMWTKVVPKYEGYNPDYFGHDPRGGLVVDFRPDPSAPYLSRHSRCYDQPQPQIYESLLACDLPTGSCPTVTTSRPISARSYYSGVEDAGLETEIAYRIQRYIDYHRPQTDSTGRESEHPPRKQFLIGRYVPHFCSFVNRLPLHERPQSACRTPRKGWAAVETGEIADDSTSIFDLSSRRSFSTSGFEGRATSPSSVGTHGSDGDGGDGDEGGDGRGDSGDDRGTRGQNNKRQTKIDVKITPVRSDRNGVKTQERKGIVNFGFPVSKPPPFLSNKPSKTKKVAKKTTASKKSKKENSSKSKTSKSSAQQNKPVTVPPDAIILLEQIVDAAGGDKDGSDDDTRRSRSCMRKKEKKVVEKPVKEEEKEEEVRPDIKTEERIYDQPTTIFDDNKYDDTPELPQVDSQLPELPVFPTPEPPKEPKSQQSKQRSLISAPSSLKSSKLESDDESRTRPEFDIGVVMDVHVDESTPKPKVQPWLQGRLALSQQSSRFELPMDMKLLESMSPLEYLRRHCVISTRRQNLYQKMFQKHKDKAGVILYKDLEKALNDVLVNAVNTQRLEYFSQLLQIPDDIKLDCRLFSCIAALIERLLYPVFLTDDTADLPGFQKEKIECADFCALDWKFHGVKVNPPVERLLKSIA